MASNPKEKAVTLPALDGQEWLFFRDRLREARYGALADAEGFQQMCFAFEALGARLRIDSGTLEKYQRFLGELVQQSKPVGYQDFDILYEAVKQARNDVMHTGAYARNAAVSAVQLSLLIEDAILSKLEKLKEATMARKTVGDFMVRSPVTAERWHTVGHVRRQMLLHSFSYLPIFWKDKWHLISDMAMASMLQQLSNPERNLLAAKRIEEVLCDQAPELKLQPAVTVAANCEVGLLLICDQNPGLWLVVNSVKDDGLNELVGVLSPFELM